MFKDLVEAFKKKIPMLPRMGTSKNRVNYTGAGLIKCPTWVENHFFYVKKCGKFKKIRV